MTAYNTEKMRFAFGENWRDFSKLVDTAALDSAIKDIEEKLGVDAVRGKRVVDVGCGSGLHSLAMHMLGAESIVSFDYDPISVETTRGLHKGVDAPANWRVEQGSILDANYVTSLGQFAVVYSWGVLHHTGDMWKALENAFSLVEEKGRIFLGLYQKGPNYPRHLVMKKRYNTACIPLKRWMEFRLHIWPIMKHRLAQKKNPLHWNQRRPRGMSTYHDIKDWLGGLPYEVASVEEVTRFAEAWGFHTHFVLERPEGGINVFVFGREATNSVGQQDRKTG